MPRPVQLTVSPEIQSYVAIALVLAAVAWMVRRFIGGKAKTRMWGRLRVPYQSIQG